MNSLNRPFPLLSLICLSVNSDKSLSSEANTLHVLLLADRQGTTLHVLLLADRQDTAQQWEGKYTDSHRHCLQFTAVPNSLFVTSD